MPSLQAKAFGGSDTSVQYDQKPDHCPLCHHAVDPKMFSSAVLVGGDVHGHETVLEVVFQCTRQACARLFIGRYSRFGGGGRILSDTFQLRKTTPTNFVPPSIDPDVLKISPMFATVYSQAASAEASDLDQIAGVGYRKALEFVVKDYCIQQDQSAKDAIEKEFLSVTIESRVADPNVKQCAKRATWLGNDETHYVRKWEDKDIKDLKVLIQLTVNWIKNSVLTKKYLEDMAEGRK